MIMHPFRPAFRLTAVFAFFLPVVAWAELPKLAPGSRDLLTTDQGVISREIHEPKGAGLPVRSSDKSPIGNNVKATGVALSDDGATMVVTCAEGEVLVGSATTKKTRARFRTALGRNLAPVAVSADGKRLALASRFEKTVEIWSDQGKPLARFEIPAEAVSLRFSPEGSFLVAGSDEHVSVFDLGAQTLWGTLRVDGAALGAVAVSPDEKLIAVGYLFHVAVWNLADDRIVWRRASVAQTPIRALAFSAQGSRLASCYLSPWVDIWNVEDGNSLGGFSPEAGCDAAAFLDEEQVLVSRGAGGPLVAYSIDGREKTRYERKPVNVEVPSWTTLTPSGKTAVFQPAASCRLEDILLWYKPEN